MNKSSSEPIRLRDVAREAGVSQGTASNVFNRPEVVREEVRARVLEAAEKLGYAGPSVAGRLLRAGKVNAVGVAAIEPLSYFFEDPWARNLLKHISDICDAQGAGVALVSAKSDERLDWNIQSAVVDGFILLCVEGGDRLVEVTRARQLPYVALAIGGDDPSIPAIGVDNVSGAKLAAEHLLSLGHRHLAALATTFGIDGMGYADEAHVRAAMYSTSRDRAFGYWEALGDVGLNPADMPIYETRETRDSTHAMIELMFAAEQRPTGILAMSDKLAMWSLEWLAARKIKVPEDVSVIGFDGVPEAAFSLPPLTTMEQPMAKIARMAVDAAMGGEQIAGKHLLDAVIVVRESTAPPR
ncbi:LacI family DNA-binding transcriptional regulator [Devosia rhizoryzae]|uniref:LacI family DNA-binding transcriptional regulator n=1 Tax=Devosia rhizoryzae TaxID=2774137 RepID=A0ABX7C6M9_9HYPH|nr:LacI family DNA-binding transcriptional regulator [Devosia rhizoryzae]QQR39920.1 LacI family DNA-binding transcriptional regulator [Devosia rhizoryzae]